MVCCLQGLYGLFDTMTQKHVEGSREFRMHPLLSCSSTMAVNSVTPADATVLKCNSAVDFEPLLIA